MHRVVARSGTVYTYAGIPTDTYTLHRGLRGGTSPEQDATLVRRRPENVAHKPARGMECRVLHVLPSWGYTCSWTAHPPRLLEDHGHTPNNPWVRTVNYDCDTSSLRKRLRMFAVATGTLTEAPRRWTVTRLQTPRAVAATTCRGGVNTASLPA